MKLTHLGLLAATLGVLPAVTYAQPAPDERDGRDDVRQPEERYDRDDEYGDEDGGPRRRGRAERRTNGDRPAPRSSDNKRGDEQFGDDDFDEGHPRFDRRLPHGETREGRDHEGRDGEERFGDGPRGPRRRDDFRSEDFRGGPSRDGFNRGPGPRGRMGGRDGRERGRMGHEPFGGTRGEGRRGAEFRDDQQERRQDWENQTERGLRRNTQPGARRDDSIARRGQSTPARPYYGTGHETVSGTVTTVITDGTVGILTNDSRTFWARLPKGNNTAVRVGQRVELTGEWKDGLLAASNLNTR